jgi:hypothetical protein
VFVQHANIAFEPQSSPTAALCIVADPTVVLHPYVRYLVNLPAVSAQSDGVVEFLGSKGALRIRVTHVQIGSSAHQVTCAMIVREMSGGRPRRDQVPAGRVVNDSRIDETKLR